MDGNMRKLLVLSNDLDLRRGVQLECGFEELLPKNICSGKCWWVWCNKSQSTYRSCLELNSKLVWVLGWDLFVVTELRLFC